MYGKAKLYGIVYFWFDFIIQSLWVFGISHNEWIYKCSLHNSVLLWCFAEGIFGESRALGWLALVVMLTVILATVYFLYALFRKKDGFLIPLIISLLNIIAHIIFNFDEPIAYIGLAYKIVGCVIYIYICYKGRKNCRGQGESFAS